MILFKKLIPSFYGVPFVLLLFITCCDAGVMSVLGLSVFGHNPSNTFRQPFLLTSDLQVPTKPEQIKPESVLVVDWFDIKSRRVPSIKSFNKEGTVVGSLPRLIRRKRFFWPSSNSSDDGTTTGSPTTTEASTTKRGWFSRMASKVKYGYSAVKDGFKSAGRKLKKGFRRIRLHFTRDDEKFDLFVNKVKERVDQGDENAINMLNKFGINMQYDKDGKPIGTCVNETASEVEDVLKSEGIYYSGNETLEELPDSRDTVVAEPSHSNITDVTYTSISEQPKTNYSYTSTITLHDQDSPSANHSESTLSSVENEILKSSSTTKKIPLSTPTASTTASTTTVMPTTTHITTPKFISTLSITVKSTSTYPPTLTTATPKASTTPTTTPQSTNNSPTTTHLPTTTLTPKPTTTIRKSTTTTTTPASTTQGGPTTPPPFPDIFREVGVRNRLHDVFMHGDFSHDDLRTTFEFDPALYADYYNYDY